MKPCSPHSQQSTLGGWSVENLQLHWACCRGEGLQRQGWLAAALPTCTWVCLCKDRTGWNEGAAMSITSKWEKQTFLWSVVSVIFSRVTHSLRKFPTRMRATQAKQSHPASGYSVFSPSVFPISYKDDLLWLCCASTLLLWHMGVDDEQVSSPPRLMEHCWPVWASWPGVRLCFVLDQVYSCAWFIKVDSPSQMNMAVQHLVLPCSQWTLCSHDTVPLGTTCWPYYMQQMFP